MSRGTKAGAVMAGLALLGAALAGGCARTHQFSGMLRYGNLMTKELADEATEAARAQLLARAEALGVEPSYVKGNTIEFRMQAPEYVVTLGDGTTERRFDPRVVRAEVFIDDRLGQTVYRYYCWIEGTEPVSFSDENRARFAVALLALREMLETPIETDLLGG